MLAAVVHMMFLQLHSNENLELAVFLWNQKTMALVCRISYDIENIILYSSLIQCS